VMQTCKTRNGDRTEIDSLTTGVRASSGETVFETEGQCRGSDETRLV